MEMESEIPVTIAQIIGIKNKKITMEMVWVINVIIVQPYTMLNKETGIMIHVGMLVTIAKCI